MNPVYTSGDCCPVWLAYWRPCVDRNYLVDAASCGHAPGAPTPVGGIEAAGERRYLTVIFCDLVGSTGMAAKLDAEVGRGGQLATSSTAGAILPVVCFVLGVN